MRATFDADTAAADHERPILCPWSQLREPIGERFEQRLHEGNFRGLGARRTRKIGQVIQLVRGAQYIPRGARMEF